MFKQEVMSISDLVNIYLRKEGLETPLLQNALLTHGVLWLGVLSRGILRRNI